MKKHIAIAVICLVAVISLKGTFLKSEPPRRLELLFLGHTAKNHDSEKLAEILSKEYFKSGINITYTTNVNDLNNTVLPKYDGLIVYANYDRITDSQAEALLSFVKSGKGFIPLHSASFCFRNNDEVVKLIGGQFKSHKTGDFAMTVRDGKHEIMKGLAPFTTWDETYVHTKINPAIHVITERVEGDHREPYTWTNTYGKGRVFYTAYGHDEKTFNNAGFKQLVYNGILWAVGKDAAKDLAKLKKPQPTYTDADIPNYEKRDPAPKLQAVLSPAESQLLTQIPVGFKMQLFAQEPQIQKPIAMAWDERGRLWVVETVDYPNTVLENKDQGSDRITICEDTNGDGKADKFTVFADKLNLPTSIVFANGGVIVAQAPHTLFLKDTNGDDKADIRETIITGWGFNDTHAVASSLHYGFDNTIWGTVGYSGYNGTVGGKQMRMSNAAFRFAVDGKWMDHVGNLSNNTWGVGFSENNDIFYSTANNSHSDYLGVHQRYLATIGLPPATSILKIDGHYGVHAVTKNLRQVDVFDGFTAAAGHNLYTARNYPKEYWNRIAFVTEPTARLIHRSILEKDGSGFKEQDGWSLLASADEWMAPVHAEVGPDGAVWVADWYNFIIQHNPTPKGFENGKGNAYVNPLRDRTHGRIYRIVYEGAKPSDVKKIDKNNTDDLIKGLKSDNMFWRMTAQRLIVESGNKAIAPQLYNLIRDTKLDEIGLNPTAVHALWTLHGLNMLDGSNAEALSVAEGALKHPAAGVRKAAAQVLPATERSSKAFVGASMIKDADLNTRKEAILALADMPQSDEIGTLLLAAQKDEVNAKDKWIAIALEAGIAKHVKGAAETILAKNKENVEAEALARVPANRVTTIKVGVIQNEMKFDTKAITARAGSVVEIEFSNPDFMQHNLLILAKGSMDKVGEAADKLAQDPKGIEMQYIPKMPEVLFATKLINPNETVKIRFRVPQEAGDYPFICSFPGHWRIMNGVLTVTAAQGPPQPR